MCAAPNSRIPLSELCLVLRSDNIQVMHFGVKVQYKHIGVSAQINLKDYSFYSFHPIMIKLGTSSSKLCSDKKIPPPPRATGGPLKGVNYVKFQKRYSSFKY